MSFWIFVGGCPRSGTTLTGQLVGQAIRGQVVPESQFKKALLRQRTWSRADVARLLSRSTPFLLWDVGLEFLHELPDRLGVAALMDMVALLKVPAGIAPPRFFVDHTPSNMELAGMLGSAFHGRCAFIHVVRNPVGVVNSVARSDWGPSGYLRGARWWADHMGRCLIGERETAGDCLRVPFESLVTETDEELARVCRWLEARNPGGAGVPGNDASIMDWPGRPVLVDPARAVAWQTEVPSYAQHALMRAFPPDLLSTVCVLEGLGSPASPTDVMRAVGQNAWGAVKERTSDRLRYRLRRRARLREVAAPRR
jgi:hypothetical protein